MANSYLTKTFGTPTDTKKYTMSVWVKRSKLGVQQSIARSTNGNDDSHVFTFNSDDSLRWDEYGSSSTIGTLKTTRKFRDTSAWYHVVLWYDSANGTAGDRMRMWINGVEETSFATDTNPSVNAASAFNKASQPINIGRTSYGSGGNYFEGYLAHMAFVDGLNVAHTTFGETDSTSGIWKFKSPSGVTWGTNGFHLKFENSGALGTDSSGNTNTFTVNGNLKQALDTPSNVYATLNPLQMIQTNAGTLSEGNLKLVSNGSDWTTLISTIAAYNGKYYAECKATSISASDFGGFGIVSANQHSLASLIGTSTVALGVGYQSNGGRYENGNLTSSYFATFTTGDILALALDLDNETLQFYKNGSTTGSQIDISSMIATSNYPIHIGCSGHTNSTLAMNFGNGYFGTTAISSAGSNGNGSLFEYDVPSGFYALNTKNINTYG